MRCQGSASLLSEAHHGCSLDAKDRGARQKNGRNENSPESKRERELTTMKKSSRTMQKQQQKTRKSNWKTAQQCKGAAANTEETVESTRSLFVF